MGPSLFPWGSREQPRHDDKRRSHVLGQFPQGMPTPSPYQTTTPSTSHPNSSAALGTTHTLQGRTAMKAARKLQRLQQPASLIEFVRRFLAPRVWKQARQCVADRRSKPRWDSQPPVLVLVAMAWAVGDSESERFVAARGFHVVSREARKRPGETLAGFQKALARLPVRQLWALAQGVRDEIRRRYAKRLMIGGFVPMGCDRSRIECPRSAELEARMGKGSSEASAPTAWVTAFVHLESGLPWSWRIGKGTADERLHLRQMLSLLPAEALVVADAAYMGYELARAILQHKQSFLLRMSSKVRLYARDEPHIEQWQEGIVYYWTETVQKKQQPPMLCRLIRVKAKGQTKHDVWFLTNVLSAQRLSAKTAAKSYRWRWRDEGLFRTPRHSRQAGGGLRGRVLECRSCS